VAVTTHNLQHLSVYHPAGKNEENASTQSTHNTTNPIPSHLKLFSLIPQFSTCKTIGNFVFDYTMNFLFASSSDSSKLPEQLQQQPSSTSDTSSTSSTTAEDWQRRIYSLQSERCTPAMRLQHKQQEQSKQARKKRIETSCKSARRLETANYLSSASNMCTLQSFSAPMSSRGGGANVKEMYKQSTPKTFDRAQKIQRSCRRRAMEESNGDKDEDEDEDLNELTNELEQEMQGIAVASPAILSSVQTFGAMSSSQRAQATSSMNSELLTLLKQLEVEPTDDAELTAKFALFETLLQTVTVIREQTLAFWSENQDLFEGGSRVAAQKEVTKIDAEDCLGIADDPRRWFVYGMTKKANENSGKIAQTLSLLRSRLEQISSSEVGDCPFCLEDMGPMKAAAGEGEQTTQTQTQTQTTIVLSCCHRVCTPCWEQWQQVKGRHAFCPLCRSDEFVAEVLSSPMAGGAV
jgi:hypothetical protein